MPSFGWGFNGRNRIGIDGFVVHRSGTGSPSSSTRATSQIQALQISTPHDSHPPFFLTSYCNGHQGSIYRLTMLNHYKSGSLQSHQATAGGSSMVSCSAFGHCARPKFGATWQRRDSKHVQHVKHAHSSPSGLSRCGTVQSHKHKHF